MKLFQIVAARRASMRVHGCAAIAAIAAISGLALPTAHAADPVPGSFDNTFASGTGKLATLSMGPSNDRAPALLLQADGKYVLAGGCSTGGIFNFCAARLNVDGSFDTTFDGPSGVGNGKVLIAIGSSDDVGSVAALQTDGKIVIGGTCYDGSNYRFCAMRLNTNGTLDPSFVGPAGNGAGKFFLPLMGSAGDDAPFAMTVQPDGRILMVGRCNIGGGMRICAMRLNADGALDATFNGPSGSGAGKFLLTVGTVSDWGMSVALQPDGKIVIGGFCETASNRDFCLVRLNRNGSFDTSLIGPSGSAGGKFLLTVGSGDDEANAIALQPDGKIVLGGTCRNPTTQQFCAGRFFDDGSPDATFVGPGGAGAGKFLLPLSSGEASNIATAMALQADGKIILAGSCEVAADYFCLRRLQDDGAFDTTFDGPSGNGNGAYRAAIGNFDDALRAILVQPDGKIVASGYCGNSNNDDFCIARFNGGPFGGRQCSFDLDGDGQVLATTDMLIATRVALGVRGTAAVAGVTFPFAATRYTWSMIREYLINQCGMNLN